MLYCCTTIADHEAATTQPAWQNLISLPITRILSPQFFLVLLDQQFMVFDTSKFRGHEADRDVKILCPIWKSGELIYHPANISSSLHVVPYLIDGRKMHIQEPCFALRSLEYHVRR